MNITTDIRYIGVNDHRIDLFEGQYEVPNGMAYNSYVIMDYKIAVMDTVDQKFTKQWLGNLAAVLGQRKPDYLVVQHMEPDHSASITDFMAQYPEAKIVSSAKAFPMMQNFFGTDFPERQIVIKEGDNLLLGRHILSFVAAPMVHWPEVMMTYDETEKVLFSADGFGKFGANDVEDPEGWACEARRYYFGIVGKYGAQVQAVLKKAANLDIRIICPLHGPVLNENLGYYLGLYNTWSGYGVESEGVFIAYTSVYGHTKAAVELLAKKLKEKGCPKVSVADLAREDMFECVEDAFRYGRVVLATTTYNAEIFPFMREFINHLVERGWKNRTVGLIENGSWAPLAAKVMKQMLEPCK
ncbi:MAG: FprA family A-type flavoprotein, partial [Oscillospiraceae bacterium]|nr:FprA family A-type flavoprotein [Oscillospiraceae bacterium]